MKNIKNDVVRRMTVKEFNEYLVRSIIEQMNLDIDVEKCLLVMNERQTRTNLNRAVRYKIKTTITRNGKNEEIFLRYIAEILKGFRAEEENGAMAWRDENDKDWHIEYDYKNRVVKATISNEKIIREVIEMEESIKEWETKMEAEMTA